MNQVEIKNIPLAPRLGEENGEIKINGIKLNGVKSFNLRGSYGDLCYFDVDLYCQNPDVKVENSIVNFSFEDINTGKRYQITGRLSEFQEIEN